MDGMTGLLGAIPQGMDPQKAGLLAAAFQGLQASGPSRMPVSLGQAMGQAGQAGMQANQAATLQQQRGQQLGMQTQMQQLQYAQHMEAMKKAQEQKRQIEAYAQTLPPEQRAGFMVNPGAYITESLKRHSLKPEESLVTGSGAVVAKGPDKLPEMKADALGILRYSTGPDIGKPVPGFEQKKLPPGYVPTANGSMEIDPAYLKGQSQIGAASRPQTTVISKVEPSAYIAGNNDFITKAYRPAIDAADLARSSNQQITALRGLNITKDTKWGDDVKAKAARVLNGLGIADDQARALAADSEKFNSIIGQRVFEILGSQKGPQTEGDAQRAFDTQAKLGNTSAGNAFILDLAEATNRATMRKAKFYADNIPSARATGDLTRIESNWMSAPENKSIFEDMVMKKWISPQTPQKPKPMGSTKTIDFRSLPPGDGG